MTLFLCISIIFFSRILYPIFNSNEVIITYGLEPFDINRDYPKMWYYLKIIYMVTFIFSNLIYSNFIYSKLIIRFFKTEKKKLEVKVNKDQINLLIGRDEKNNINIYLPESGLYQNFLITGTIGSGKTKQTDVAT